MTRNGTDVLSFLRHEATGGACLILATALALICANTALAPLYAAFLETPVVVQAGALTLAKPLLLWINDGLMAIFFLLVALEIKRELLTGELSTLDRACMPAIAAIGGMIVPAVVYLAINAGNPQALAGWAIPTATDIAFAVAVLALLGSRVPPALKVFLLALAIIDDLGAIVIIAAVYTDNLSLRALALAAAGILVLAVLNRRGVTRISPYAVTGVFIWICVLKSGVHATLAGVVVGLFIPLRDPSSGTEDGPLHRAEAALHPWVAFGVLPLFAFANAGVSLEVASWSKLLEPVPLGIAVGLFAGKQTGILAATWLAVRSGIGRLPEGSDWTQLWGVAILGGIGFTMSLFIGTLAFPHGGNAAEIRIGVIAGSIVSALVGYALLRRATRRASPSTPDTSGGGR